MKPHRSLQWSLPIVVTLLVSCKGGTEPLPPARHALQFDGADDYVQVADHASLDFGTGDFTWEVWLKRSRTGVREDVLTKKDVFGDSEHDVALYFDRDDRAYAFLRERPFTLQSVVRSATPVGTGWTHLAMTRSQGILRLYVNGRLEGSEAAPFDVTSSGPFRIGANRYNNADANAGAVFPFSGLVREVRIWSVARTESQLSAATSSCPSRRAAGLVARYRFNEGSGEVLHDASGNGNLGTLRNGPVWMDAPLLCP